MLEFLRDTGRASDRKLRLFACGCARSVGHCLTTRNTRQAVEVAERFADGLATLEERNAARDVLYRRWMAGAEVDDVQERMIDRDSWAVAKCTLDNEIARTYAWGFACALTRPYQPGLLRDFIGPLPFRTVPIPTAVLEWNDRCVVKLATSIYMEREMPSGVLNAGRLAVLADALEEAGLGDQEVLQHLREQGGVHVRGCWCVDFLLGKS
jgi:hypothetical protein